MIKTYDKFHENKSDIDFEILRMEDIYKSRSGKPDEPHRHNYYTTLLVKDGSGTHSIDFNSFPIEKNKVFFVAPGQVHQVIEKSEPSGFALFFSQEFLIKNHLDERFLSELNLFHSFGYSPPLSLETDEIIKLCEISDELIEVTNSNIKFKSEAISALLKLFLIRCNNLCTLNIENTQVLNSAQSLLKDFKNLIEEKYKEWHLLNNYADALFVTPDHLNRVVKSIANKTAKEFIQDKITTEAKRLMYFTDSSNKEIAYSLGFSEPAHFSSFFKNCTGLSPSSFKKSF